MQEAEKILYELGYFQSDPNKVELAKGWIEEANEFMQSCGVPTEMLIGARAYAVKFLWADARDKGETEKMLSASNVLVQLIVQMRG